MLRLADELYRYDPLHYLVVSVTLPVAGCVIRASSDEPYICVRLDIDPSLIAGLVAEASLPPTPKETEGRGLYLDRIDAPLLVSARRWENRGTIRQTLRNWAMLVAVHLGVPPAMLARHYPRTT